MSKLYFLFIVLFLIAGEVKADIFLVKNREPSSTIVISSQATEKEKKAANILQNYLFKISGATLPIKRDNETIEGVIISIGKTSLLPSDIKEKLKLNEKLLFIDPFRDSFIIATEGTDKLFLIGHRDEGTIFAVYDFLESLGCRWFFACEAGKVIPHLPTIKIKNIDVLKYPDFAYRRHEAWGGHRTGKTVKAEKRWFEENKMSVERIKGLCGHNFYLIWPRSLYEEHPEYFPLINGKRIKGGQICVSNPEVIKIGIKWAFKTLKKHPDYDVVSFIVNDGEWQDRMGGYCHCENCKKIGNPADQCLYLANQVGKELFKKYPDKMICIMSYFGSAVVPHIKADGYDEHKDRVLVEIYTNFAKTPFNKLVEGWAKASHYLIIGDAWQWFYYGWSNPGRPCSYISRLQRYPFFKKNNVIGIRTMTKAEWARHGLARYLSAKLMWNVNEDIEKLKQDFCEKMFPSASTDFYNFISLYEEFDRKDIDLKGFLKKGFYFMNKIKKKIKTEEEKKRWEFYALYLYEEVLEYKLTLAKTKKERYKINKKIVSFLKGTEDLGILESSQRIPIIYYKRIKHLTGGELPDMPPMEINSEKIEELFNQYKKLFRPSRIIQREPLK